MCTHLSWKFLLACPLLFWACSDPPPPMLNSEDRHLIDSLSKKEALALKPFYDSLCEATFDQRVRHAVDSIMEIRLAEIEAQKRRIQEKAKQ